MTDSMIDKYYSTLLHKLQDMVSMLDRIVCQKCGIVTVFYEYSTNMYKEKVCDLTHGYSMLGLSLVDKKFSLLAIKEDLSSEVKNLAKENKVLN